MRFAVFLLIALVLILLVGVLPAGGAPPQAVFRSPLFVALLGLLGVSSLVCSLGALVRAMRRRRFKMVTLGFILAHVSVILILMGALIRFVAGEEGVFVLPLESSSPISTSYDEKITLDFGLMARDLNITYYEPTHYDLFILDRDVDGDDNPHVFDQRIEIPEKGSQLLAKDLAVDLEDLHDADGEWLPFYQLTNGSILQIGRMVKHYEADIGFSDRDRPVQTETIAVNHPILHEKWRFYLMDAKEGQPFIVLSGKQDPGWPYVHVGFWLLLVGVVVLGFSRPGAW